MKTGVFGVSAQGYRYLPEILSVVFPTPCAKKRFLFTGFSKGFPQHFHWQSISALVVFFPGDDENGEFAGGNNEGVANPRGNLGVSGQNRLEEKSEGRGRKEEYTGSAACL